jgi:hypothetical protein
MKNSHSRSVRRAVLSCIAAVALFPTVSSAQTSSEALQWRASIYGWLPDMNITTRFPTGASGPSIEVEASDALAALKFAFAGTLEVSNGRWGAFTDVVYVDVGGDQSNSRDFTIGSAGLPAGITVDADGDIKTWFWTLAGTFRISDTPRNSTELMFGVRMLSVDQTLDYSINGDFASVGLPERSGSAEVSATNWDAIIGVKGSATLSENGNWIAPYRVDVGTGESKLTWQALAGVGYVFDWGSTVLGWRYVDYEMEADATFQTVGFSGPFLGLAFQW